jgi:hypothetical protein
MILRLVRPVLGAEQVDYSVSTKEHLRFRTEYI